MGCSSLSTVYVPSTVTSVGSDAFCNLSSGSIIYVTDSRVQGEFIAAYNSGYNYYSSYTTVTIDTIQDSTLKYTVNRLNKTALVSGVVSTSITSITIPEYVQDFKVIGIGFQGLTKATKCTTINAPYIERIGFQALYGRTALKSFDAPNLKVIGEKAFMNCTGLSDLVIVDSVIEIDAYAFHNVPHVTYHGTCSDANNWNAVSFN